MRYLLVVGLIIVTFFIGYYIGSSRTQSIETADYPNCVSEHTCDILKEKLQTDDALEVIKNDLLSKSELIPFEGVLGGRQGFYDEEGIIIINERWVLASFEDGHIGGEVLLKYEIDDNRNISWAVVDSYLY